MPALDTSDLPVDPVPRSNGGDHATESNGAVELTKVVPESSLSAPIPATDSIAHPQQQPSADTTAMDTDAEVAKPVEVAKVPGEVEAKPTTGDAEGHIGSNGVAAPKTKAEETDATGGPTSESVVLLSSGQEAPAAVSDVKPPAVPLASTEAPANPLSEAGDASAVNQGLRKPETPADPVSSYEAGATTGVPPVAEGPTASPAVPPPTAPEPAAPAEPGAAVPPASAAPGAQAPPVPPPASSPVAHTAGSDASGSQAAKRHRKSTTHFAEPGVVNTQLAPANLVGMTAAQIKYAQAAIKTLMKRPEAFAFNEPVDPVAAGIPTYLDVVKRPMDFRTVDHKLNFSSAALQRRPNDKLIAGAKVGLNPSKDVYANAQEWVDDVRRIFSNCRLFNGAEHPISQSGDTLENLFNGQLPKLPAADPPPPSPSVATASSSKARRPSNAAPAARRSSVDDGTGRPKREVHAPSRELPWQDEPNKGASTGTRPRRTTGSAREEAHYTKVNADELKHCTKVITELLSQPTIQNYAWVFNDLPARDLDFAPAYYKMIKKPISLFMVSERAKAKEYESRAEFEADMNQLFKNCYTFNAPGHDVYVFGQKLQDAYNEKMARMPKHRSLSPEEEDDDVDAEADEDEEEYDEEMDEDAKIRAQIAALEAKLHKPKGSKSSKSAPAGAGTSKGKKRAASDIAGGAVPAGAASKKKAPPKKAAAAQPAAAVEASPAAAKKAKAAPKKKAAPPSKKSNGVEEEVRTVTYEQKEELAAKITQLPDDRLDGALKIIAEDKPQSSTDDEEIELDIDDLSPRTLYRLYRYVVRPKHKKATKSSAVDGRKRGTGGVKRKNLDEDEEADRIARLQAQLSQFDNPDAAASAPTSGGHAGAHDDHVQSESSDEGSESESESDY
ncbi:Transcription initiation factor TFIID, subunit BDF1 and related bromodomain proteins [Ceraceosorus bombacis]|uniref:Transcription initiation factor TFIID, subunit BDF1 and related bromodomain proteins n=1 Tax=Ceraceosorus bombacis TaxID=401625 RepID=A0A0P1BDR5_9BASI|nr:Transcription initiation factor TFIID, subunit BDF1 and related bromodomain proteins [Ceraceosorus bombacis]